jgi:hypothetical protein
VYVQRNRSLHTHMQTKKQEILRERKKINWIDSTVNESHRGVRGLETISPVECSQEVAARPSGKGNAYDTN